MLYKSKLFSALYEERNNFWAPGGGKGERKPLKEKPQGRKGLAWNVLRSKYL